MKIVIEVTPSIEEHISLQQAIEDGDITWVQEILGGLRVIGVEEYFENETK